MNIKVQIEKDSINASVNHGFRKEGEFLTFIAYSDQMKARILESLVRDKTANIYISETTERRNGEWYETLSKNAHHLVGNNIHQDYYQFDATDVEIKY